MAYAWNMRGILHGIHMEHAWVMLGICAKKHKSPPKAQGMTREPEGMTRVWRIPDQVGVQRFVGYAWNMRGICVEYAWNMHGIRMEYAWNMHGI